MAFVQQLQSSLNQIIPLNLKESLGQPPGLLSGAKIRVVSKHYIPLNLKKLRIKSIYKTNGHPSADPLTSHLLLRVLEEVSSQFPERVHVRLQSSSLNSEG